jgi:hypothetical protein
MPPASICLEMPSHQYEAGSEVDCLIDTGEGPRVRGFLKLPGTDVAGELRLVSDLPAPFDLEDVTPLRYVLQDVGAGTPGCISKGFVIHHGISFPTPSAFPLRIHVNEVILGGDDPTSPLSDGFIDCKDMLDFFLGPQIGLAEAAEQNFIAVERLSLPFGDMKIKVEEISQRDSGQSNISIDFTSRLVLQGDPRSAHDWIAPIARAMGFFSFCLDRPLGFNWVGGSQADTHATLYASWRKPSAPLDTVPLLRDGSVGTKELAAASNAWSQLWADARPFMEHVHALQLRRDGLTIDDRLMVLTRTLELYHGYASRFQSALRSRSANKELREAIISALPDSAKGAEPWLRNSINEANRKRLSMQLEELLTDLGPEVAQACGITGRTGTFAKLVVKTRNFLTHPKKQVPKGVPEGLGLLEMVHRLWFLTRACVLVELGFSRAFIASALTESAHRHYLVNGRGWAQH